MKDERAVPNELDALEKFATSELSLSAELSDSFVQDAAVLKGNAMGIIYDGDSSTSTEKVQRMLMLVPALFTVVDEARDTIARLRDLELQNVGELHQVFIKSTPETIWESITSPHLTRRFFYGASITVEPGRIVSIGPDGDRWMDEAVTEFVPPRRLVHSWRSLYDPRLAIEPASRVTWQIDEIGNGVCRVALRHDQLESSPKTAAAVLGNGWMFVLSSLKSFVETGVGLGSEGF